MSPAGVQKRQEILINKDYTKPRFCRNSSTNWCVSKNVKECAVISCGEGATVPWEGVY